MKEKKWNTRYVCYAKSLGRTPEEHQALSKDDPLCNIDFMQWNRKRIMEYREVNPGAFHHGLGNDWSLLDHASYDQWLSSVVGLEIEQ